MYRPSMYNKHDETMNNFALLFNEAKSNNHIEMRPNPVETFDNDGIFIDIHTKQSIGYDWEYRDRYFEYCKLQFDTLGQYERKLRKPSIQIAIQCDSTETGIAVGWHEDWLEEEKEQRSLKTDFSNREYGGTRYTTHFEIYRFDEVDRFKNMIAMAMRTKVYSAKIFEMMQNESTNPAVITQISTRKAPIGPNRDSNMKSFFESKGLEVIDKRGNGGCLWVVGSQKEIGVIVDEAKRKFGATGYFGVGRATKQRIGWYTKSTR